MLVKAKLMLLIIIIYSLSEPELESELERAAAGHAKIDCRELWNNAKKMRKIVQNCGKKVGNCGNL